MVRGLTAGVALAVALAAAGCGGGALPKEKVAATTDATTGTTVAGSGFRGTRVLGSSVATDFALHDQDGRLVRLSAEHGKFVLVTFLYTKCPDVCPILASNLNQALRGLPQLDRRDTQVIAVSTDPIRDTHRAVRKYVAEHRLVSQFRYVIGSADELKPVWQAYNILVEPGPKGNIAHGVYVLLLDRSGMPLLYYPPQVRAADLSHDLRRLMRNGA